MTNEQINCAIAKACGWTEIQVCTCWDDTFRGRPAGKTELKHIEDYCSDLNAMQEAISILNEDQFVDFIWELMSLSHEPMLSTARQRAEAFLRTLGKWKATDKESLTVAATTEESSADHFRDATKKKEV